jgi:type IV pilus modification protein PilV
MKTSIARKQAQKGYTLVEVLVGILIFAVGMMALAQLQGNLAQNSSDSNARTVAANLAEEAIETARSFSQITSDGINDAYNDIVDGTATVTRAGNVYTVTTDVTDYYYLPDSETFTTVAPTGAASSDYKVMELTVSWNQKTEFRVDETQTTGDLGTGSITLTEVVSSITSPSGGKVALGTGGNTSYAPPVDYEPGQNPEIVSIDLGDYKFKESTTPLPDVIRADELVETRFDVVTYSNPVNSDATFLRREEFRAVSCECRLRIPTADTQGGLRPTIWNGEDYTEGEFVSKPYGESASNQQSDFCDICCRDHHDGGSGAEDLLYDPGTSRYDPFRASSGYHSSGGLAGDHIHYKRSNTGYLEPAIADGDVYVEACRLVRKDGFFRVAQDLRQEGLNSFPANYLDDSGEVEEYSDYVTGAVEAYETEMNLDLDYPNTPPSLNSPTAEGVTFPASSYANATQMSDSTLAEQQLRSRGIYIDFMSAELRGKINCLEIPGNTGETCQVPKVSTPLEILPFYDVQLTWLSRWNETPTNNPVDVTNQAIANDNSHSRGMAKLTEGFGYSTINAAVHNGNLGLTGTDPIDTNYASDVESYNLYAKAVDFGTPPVLSGIIISGGILSAVPGLQAADVEIEANGAQCKRTNTAFECILEEGATSPDMRVYNYDKAGKLVYACSAELVLEPPREHISLNGKGSWTNFSLDVPTSLTTDIIIKEGGC